MRPIRLTMRAFGPYGGEQVIDFRELGDYRFFLIHGPTGAGKSTLLDAICFALYGESSGDQRVARRMRSDYADTSTPTEVILDFEIAGEAYRVKRMPEQELLGKRTGTSTIVKTQATLWKVPRIAEAPGHETGIVDGHVVADKAQAVTQAVEVLLGFKSEQFRQVVMLPQGQFQQFLMAKSAERQGILEVLFQTAYFRCIEEALKAKTKGVEEKLTALRQERLSLLRQAEVEGENQLLEKADALQQALDLLQKAVETLLEAEKAARQKLSDGQMLAKKFDEKAGTEAELAVLAAQAADIAEKRQQVQQAQAAKLLLPLEDNRQQRLREATQYTEALNEATARLEAEKAGQTEALSRLQKEQARQPGRDALQAELHHLQAMADKIKKLATLQEKQSKLQSEEARLQKQLQYLEEAIKERRAAAASGIDKKEMLEAQARQVELLARQVEEWRQQQTFLERLLAKKLLLSPEPLKQLEAQRQKTDTALFEAKIRLSELEGTWIQGQAGLLARHLTNGEACPVCGSVEHPSPATQDNSPDEEDLERQRQVVDRLQTELNTLTQEENEQRAQQAGIEAEIQLLQGMISLPESTPELLASRLAELETRHRSAQKARLDLEALEVEAEKIEAEIQTLQTQQKKQMDTLNELRERLAETSGTLRAWETEIPEPLRQMDTYQATLTETEDRLKNHIQALEEATRQAQESAEVVAALSAAQAAAKATCKTAGLQAEQAKNTFIQALSESELADEVAFSKARQAIESISSLQASIQQHEQFRQSLQIKLDQLLSETKDTERPDIGTLTQALESIQKDLSHAQNAQGATREQLKQCHHLQSALATLQERAAALEGEYGTLGRLAQVASGKNEPGISFNRFVLSAMLDEVLSAASERLKMMSRGRFMLHRALERTNRTTSGGLDLEVSDALTGTTRPVNTLSGGESFLASLSLALGMADVVQSFSGGIHLQTMFIDEGFGSLDAEALDLALRALIDLQQEGRLIGIISHVPELKERIDARLEVLPTRRGSSARFVTSWAKTADVLKLPV